MRRSSRRLVTPGSTFVSWTTAAGNRPDLAPDEAGLQATLRPWDAYTPSAARALLDGIGIVWWLAGGYAVEAFTGGPREHEDIDVSIFRQDVPS
jgi:hypothetical protein